MKKCQACKEMPGEIDEEYLSKSGSIKVVISYCEECYNQFIRVNKKKVKE